MNHGKEIPHDLLQMAEGMRTVELAEVYGVSDKLIRKWCKIAGAAPKKARSGRKGGHKNSELKSYDNPAQIRCCLNCKNQECRTGVCIKIMVLAGPNSKYTLENAKYNNIH